VLDTAVNGVRSAAHGATLLEVGHDHADGLGREEGKAGEIGIGDSRIRSQHGENGELGRGNIEIRKGVVHPQAMNGLGLAQEIADVSGGTAFAFAGAGDLGWEFRGGKLGLARHISTRICCSYSNTMTSSSPDQDTNHGRSRLDWAAFRELAPAANAALLSLGEGIRGSGLELSLVELANLRASQMNGCTFCTKFHLHHLRSLGVPQAKLDLVAAWRDADEIFTERERAALAWTEVLTNLDREGAPDAAYEQVRAQFSQAELANLTATIAAINAWNRISIGFRFPPPIMPGESPRVKS
jgi:AhpD family alkylhydroperoxidase